MDDRQIEQLLRRHRPVGPPPGLRTRIHAPAPPARIWPWAVAASLALAGTIALQILSGRALDRIDVGARNETVEPAVKALSDMLGGDETARWLAEMDLERTRVLRAAAASVPPMDPDTP